MDVVTLTAFLSPFLPFLIKAGEKAADSVGSKFGEDAWNKAKGIWSALQPKVEAKPDASVAAEQVAAKPESEARRAVFQEELETLLKENPDVAEAVAQIMEGLPSASVVQITQSVNSNEGQVIGQMTNSKAIGRIEGGVQGGVNL